jgi:GNAT superfamily N-acetyltransferase
LQIKLLKNLEERPERMLEVRELKKNKEELLPFIHFAWQIYQGDPHWVAPLKNDLLKSFLGKDFTKKIQCGPHAFFMVWENNTPLGRILVGINEKKNRKTKRRVGYFGYLELVNSSEVLKCLMEYAVNWLKNQDVTTLIGPLCPDNDVEGRGLLIKGFDSPPVLMNSYNPDYYRKLLEEYGFKKDTDFFAYYTNQIANLRARLKKVSAFAMQKFRFRIDKINLKYRDREIRDIIKIIDAIVSDSREEDNGFEYANPPTYEEFALEVKKFLPFLDKDLIYIARSGEIPIGFVFALPDYNQVLRRMDGKLFPFGLFQYLWYKRKIKGIRGLAQYVIPEFRNKAVNAAIFSKILDVAERKQYEYIEGSLISENNLRSRRIFENAGIQPYKIYRVYRKVF